MLTKKSFHNLLKLASQPLQALKEKATDPDKNNAKQTRQHKAVNTSG